MDIFWFIPLHGDGRYLGTAKGARTLDYDYIKQVAQAVDRLGFQGVLLPTGKACEDAWIAASSLIGVTEKLRFLVAVRPGVMSPTHAARMAATFDRLSNGRLLINVVTGGDPYELAGDGLFLDHTERYELTDEFLQVWKRVMEGEKVSFSGNHVKVEAAELLFPGLQKPYPPIYFGGSSPAAIQIAADHVECYLTWGEPPSDVAEKIQTVKDAAAKLGKKVKFGIRLHVIVRETEEEAWQAADQLISYVDEQTVAEVKKVFSRYDSVGQQRMSQLNTGKIDRKSLEISPNLWAGVGLVRGGAGTALVGSAEQVAARMREYTELGIETFILSGYPHLEESYRVAELLFPLLPVNAQLGKVEGAKIDAASEIVGYSKRLSTESLAK